MSDRVAVEPQLLSWARDRAGLTHSALAKRFPRLRQWESGDLQPTMLQLEDFARATHVPLGMLFLPEPPEPEVLPVPDMRTIGDQLLPAPSVDLLDTINICLRRQAWYEDYAHQAGHDPIPFIGSMKTTTAPIAAAAQIREQLKYTMESRSQYATTDDALRGLAERAEHVGILVMFNGIVGSNTHRVLDPQEFRGFALASDYAPVIFINGADTKAAQVFTLAHEIGHLWLGRSGVDLPDLTAPDLPTDSADQKIRVERWCNAVAAELLVPQANLQVEFKPAAPVTAEMTRLARLFKVSTLVVLRRLRDIRALSWKGFQDLYTDELARLITLSANKSTGGDYYNTAPIRLSRRFARALITDTLQGGTTFHEAFNLIGSKKRATFDELGTKLGIS